MDSMMSCSSERVSGDQPILFLTLAIKKNNSFRLISSTCDLFPDVGTVLKVVMIPRESWHDLEEVVLEEMTVFRV